MFGSKEKKEKKREAAAEAKKVKQEEKNAKKNEGGENSGSAKGEKRSARSFMQSLWSKGLDKGKDALADGVDRGKEELVKGKQKMDAALGLGHKPNVVPSSKPNIKGKYRPVYIGWHPVAGFAGTWFAEKTGLGRKITEKINSYPDPTQHWGILVGDYVHQLWMDEKLDVIYINEKITDQEWRKFEVGKTSFNDEALRQAGEMVIYNMRQKKAAYNLITNNCQTFAVAMLEAIQAGARREFATTYAIYKRAVGEGTVAELFEVSPEEEEEDAKVGAEQAAGAAVGKPGVGAVENAQHVMEENTTTLDTHTPGRLHCC